MVTTAKEILDIPWYAVVNDLIGGWSVATRDVPCSELRINQGKDFELGCFLDEAIARDIAELHNYALSGGGCEW